MVKTYPNLSFMLGTCLVLALLAGAAPPARAQDDVDRNAIAKAENFLKTAQHGRDILSFVHFGARYRGHQYLQRLAVTDGGRRVPGCFALVYRFAWENDGSTDLALLCDARGYVYQVQVRRTNALLQQPFALADATIQVLGNALLKAFGDQLAANDRQAVQRYIANADSRHLLELSLRLQQSLGR